MLVQPIADKVVVWIRFGGIARRWDEERERTGMTVTKIRYPGGRKVHVCADERGEGVISAAMAAQHL